MPSFRTGKVVRLLEERAGLQRAEVDLGDGPERAYVLTQLTGRVDAGDPVVVNTTAVELGLGTGGWHVVHWNLARDEWSERGPGHIIKGRYTSLQADVGSTEEHLEVLAEAESIDGMPVVAAALHSQVPAVAVAVRAARPEARIVRPRRRAARPHPARRDDHLRPRVRWRLRSGVGVLRAGGGTSRRGRRRRDRRDGARDRGDQHAPRVQRSGGRFDPRRRGRARRRADRVPAGVVRRPPRPPPRTVAPHRDRVAP